MGANRNIDLQCAECGMKIAEVEGVTQSLANNALAVLLEQGIYALFLFLCSRGSKDDKAARAVGKHIDQLLEKVVLKENDGDAQEDCTSAWLKSVRDKFCLDLKKTILAKDIAEQVLIYVRYHIKARDEKSGGE